MLFIYLVAPVFLPEHVLSNLLIVVPFFATPLGMLLLLLLAPLSNPLDSCSCHHTSHPKPDLLIHKYNLGEFPCQWDSSVAIQIF